MTLSKKLIIRLQNLVESNQAALFRLEIPKNFAELPNAFFEVEYFLVFD